MDQNSVDAAKRVSVLGLGAMGATIARTILNGGNEVTVWNRTIEKADPLAAAGAEVAPSFVAAIEASPLVFTLLLDTTTTDDLLSAERPSLTGRTVVNLAAGRPEDAVSLSSLVADLGGEYLDGRIGCYPRAIGSDRSNIVCSGPRSVFDRALPILRLLGTDTRLAGEDVATANALSASMASVFHHVALAGFFEAAALADRYGIGVAEWMSMAEPMLELTREAIMVGGEQCDRGEYDGGQAAISTHLDTLVVTRQSMIDQGVDHLLVDATMTYLERAVEAGYSSEDFAAIFKILRGSVTAPPADGPQAG
jgi:3-hydroxyisobutyrate dehydrogenase-like beta-hydroxyacid dehydrogenase